jgi:hypothetical protein
MSMVQKVFSGVFFSIVAKQCVIWHGRTVCVFKLVENIDEEGVVAMRRDGAVCFRV